MTCQNPPHRPPRRVAVLTLALLTAPLAPAVLAATDADADETACRADLTCMRQSRVISARDFILDVPDISRWQPVDAPAVPGRAAAGRPTEPLRDPTTGMELVLVPGACWQVPPPAGGDDGGQAARRVCVTPLWVGVHEVSFDAYDRFARETERGAADDEGFGRGTRPVINVNLYDALAFAKWLSRQSRARYRLPTEVEWEHAARAGSTTVFPWGDEPGTGRANCDGCGSPWDGRTTAPVGSFAPNAWGLHDMIGNVGEWTCSIRDPDPAESFETCDDPYASRRRVYRNGGWSDAPDRLHAAFRDWNAAMRRTDYVGFRLVRECPECAGLPLAAASQVVRGTPTGVTP